jgi:hypothetical protein
MSNFCVCDFVGVVPRRLGAFLAVAVFASIGAVLYESMFTTPGSSPGGALVGPKQPVAMGVDILGPSSLRYRWTAGDTTST